jgi:hypothetical protein
MVAVTGNVVAADKAVEFVSCLVHNVLAIAKAFG